MGNWPRIIPEEPTRIARRSGSRRPYSALLFAACLLLASLKMPAQSSPSSSKTNDTYVLSGTVINSATGEPIPRALVRTAGRTQRTAFSDTEGHFQMEGLPSGRVGLSAQKPGFNTEQDMEVSSSGWIDIGPNTGPQVVKLVPQSAISGRVTDAAGQPIEHIGVRLTSRSLRNGRRHWESHGMTETDEDGHFRFSNLMAGTYYLAAGPMAEENRLLAAQEKPHLGYPHLYYPGSPDISSASTIQLIAGQQSEADFSLASVPLYEVSGSVSGYLPEQGVGFQVLTPSGDELSLPTTFNSETGIFHLEGAPAGTYLLRALGQAGGQQLRADVRLNIASNLDNVRLALAPTVSIPIVARTDSRDSSNTTSPAFDPDHPPVSVHLVPTEPAANEVYSAIESHGSGHDTMLLQSVDSGTYTVDVIAHPPWYVQSATYAQTNVLADDISIASGSQSYPLDLVLRSDSATLTGTLKSADATPPPQATVLVAPQAASRVGPRMAQAVGGSFSVRGLAPGDYLVYALDRVDGMEYTNPETLQPYASQAAHVTLTAGQKAQVTVDLIHVGKGD